MGFFTMRERAELDKLDKIAEVEGEIREFVRRQDDSEAEGQRVAGKLASLLNRVTGSSVQEIENLTADLLALREELQSQGERVQRDIVEYAALSQSAMQSTKIIAERLAHWKGVADALGNRTQLPTPMNPAADDLSA